MALVVGELVLLVARFLIELLGDLLGNRRGAREVGHMSLDLVPDA